MSNIKRQLPKVTGIQDVNLRTWISAATEIINALLKQGQTSSQSTTITSRTSQSSGVDTSNFELLDNKVNTLDNPSDDTYPTTRLLSSQIRRIQEEFSDINEYEEWDIANVSLEELGLTQGATLQLISDGEYLGQQLYIGDVVRIYLEDMGDSNRLNVFKVMDSHALTSGSTSDDLQEGTNNLYFTDDRVQSTTLTGLSILNAAITATNTVLDAFGRLQGQINARALTSRTISTGAGLTGGGDLTEDRELSLDATTTDIPEGSRLYFTEERVKSTLINDLPSNTGTYILKAVDGVLIWVEE